MAEFSQFARHKLHSPNLDCSQAAGPLGAMSNSDLTHASCETVQTPHGFLMTVWLLLRLTLFMRDGCIACLPVNALYPLSTSGVLCSLRAYLLPTQDFLKKRLNRPVVTQPQGQPVLIDDEVLALYLMSQPQDGYAVKTYFRPSSAGMRLELRFAVVAGETSRECMLGKQSVMSAAIQSICCPDSGYL